jgi:hypothetical protein
VVVASSDDVVLIVTDVAVVLGAEGSTLSEEQAANTTSAASSAPADRRLMPSPKHTSRGTTRMDQVGGLVRRRHHQRARAWETGHVPLDRLSSPSAARRTTAIGWRAVSWGLALCLAPALVMASCAAQGRTIGAYCDAVTERLALVVSPPLASSADIGAVLDAYRAITATAPAAIEPEWSMLVGSLETAATVVPDDPTSVAAVTDAALASTPAATRIQQYTRQNCAIDIGTPPPPTNPVTATTDPAAPTTAPAGDG